jgi:hypothetical protein
VRNKLSALRWIIVSTNSPNSCELGKAEVKNTVKEFEENPAYESTQAIVKSLAGITKALNFHTHALHNQNAILNKILVIL